jgi:hypothetical protein
MPDKLCVGGGLELTAESAALVDFLPPFLTSGLVVLSPRHVGAWRAIAWYADSLIPAIFLLAVLLWCLISISTPVALTAEAGAADEMKCGSIFAPSSAAVEGFCAADNGDNGGFCAVAVDTVWWGAFCCPSRDPERAGRSAGGASTTDPRELQSRKDSAIFYWSQLQAFLWVMLTTFWQDVATPVSQVGFFIQWVLAAGGLTVTVLAMVCTLQILSAPPEQPTFLDLVKDQTRVCVAMGTSASDFVSAKGHYDIPYNWGWNWWRLSLRMVPASSPKDAVQKYLAGDCGAVIGDFAMELAPALASLGELHRHVAMPSRLLTWTPVGLALPSDHPLRGQLMTAQAAALRDEAFQLKTASWWTGADGTTGVTCLEWRWYVYVIPLAVSFFVGTLSAFLMYMFGQADLERLVSRLEEDQAPRRVRKKHMGKAKSAEAALKKVEQLPPCTSGIGSGVDAIYGLSADSAMMHGLACELLAAQFQEIDDLVAKKEPWSPQPDENVPMPVDLMEPWAESRPGSPDIIKLGKAENTALYSKRRNSNNSSWSVFMAEDISELASPPLDLSIASQADVELQERGVSEERSPSQTAEESLGLSTSSRDDRHHLLPR